VVELFGEGDGVGDVNDLGWGGRYGRSGDRARAGVK
jgi:hypothetical protein